MRSQNTKKYFVMMIFNKREYNDHFPHHMSPYTKAEKAGRVWWYGKNFVISHLHLCK